MATSDVHPLTQATAGAIGSVVSNALVYPIDTLTTRLQTARRPSKGKASPYASLSSAIRTLHREGGISAFYSGVVSDSLSTALSNFIYFFAYTSLRDALLKRKPSPSTPKGKTAAPPLLSAIEELLVGCVSGVIAKAVVSPLSNIVVRQQTATAAREKVEGGSDQEKGRLETKDDDDSDDEDSPYGRAPSALEIARDILEEKGWTGFWSGFKSSIILTTNPAITFYAMALLQRLIIPKKHLEHPTPVQTFFTGALASSIAAAITYPLILAKTRLQFKSPSGRRMYRSTFDVFRKTIQKQGVLGLYAGLEGQLSKGFVSEGVKMTIKDRLQIVLQAALAQRRQLNAA